MNGGQYRESLTVQFYFLSKKLSEANIAKCYYLLSVKCCALFSLLFCMVGIL